MQRSTEQHWEEACVGWRSSALIACQDDRCHNFSGLKPFCLYCTLTFLPVKGHVMCREDPAS